MNRTTKQTRTLRPIAWDDAARCAVAMLSALVVFTSGCQREEPSDQASEHATPGTALQATEASKALATVNGSTIRQADLQRAITGSMGSGALAVLDARMQRRVLESMVLNRAMAQEMEATLEPAAIAEIDAQSAAYREALLAKAFIAQESDQVVPTESELRGYYEKHPELFGQKVERRFELLKGRATADDAVKQQISDLLNSAANGGTDGELSWSEFSARKAVREAGVSYHRGLLVPGLLEPRLEELIASLDEQEVSALIYIDRVPQVARVTEIKKSAPKPFSTVREDVRTSLSAVKLREAVANLKKQILDRSRIEYLTAAQE